MLLELKKVARLNISKCKSMQITRKHHPIEFTYKLQCANGEAVIERTEQERDHGVWTTSNLSWSKQVSEQCVRGNKMLCCIKRSTRNINSLHSRKRGNTSQESKYILDLPFITNTTYSQRLSQLQLLTLTYWHEYLDLIFFFKCVNGIIDVNNETSPKPPQSNKTTRSTDANCFLYQTKLCHTSTSLEQSEPGTRYLNLSDQILIHYLPSKAYFSNTTLQH